jgi:hypothetical protein
MRREDGPGKASGDDDDHLGAIANLSDLLEDLPPALGPSGKGLQDLSNQPGELAEVGKEPQGESAEEPEIDHGVIKNLIWNF